jgi:hypothetical protein
VQREEAAERLADHRDPPAAPPQVIDRLVDARRPVGPGGAIEVVDRRPVARQAHAAHGEAIARQPPTEVAHLVRRTGESMNADDAAVISVELEGFACYHTAAHIDRYPRSTIQSRESMVYTP